MSELTSPLGEAGYTEEGYVRHPAYAVYVDKLVKLHSIADSHPWTLEEIRPKLVKDAQSYQAEPNKDGFLFMMSHRLKAERMVTVLLDSFIAAVGVDDDATRNMLRQQQDEEDKHTNGVYQYYAEVLGLTDREEVLSLADEHSDPVSETLYTGLNRHLERLEQEPSMSNLAAAFFAYHQLAEGTIAFVFSRLTVEKMKQDIARKTGRQIVATPEGEEPVITDDELSISDYPGFLYGHRKVVQDEARHIAFGMEFLKMLYAYDSSLTAKAVLQSALGFQQTIDQLYSFALEAGLENLTAEGYGKTPKEIYDEVTNRLRIRLKNIDPALLTEYEQVLAASTLAQDIHGAGSYQDHGYQRHD